MGDGLKLTKDKRHRSSSSISGQEGVNATEKRHRSSTSLAGALGQRKKILSSNGNTNSRYTTPIPEGEVHFSLADSRCKKLQDKIDLMKALKRKKKSRRNSTTKIVEQEPCHENIPIISVRTQHKKKPLLASSRQRRQDAPAAGLRTYLEPPRTEQSRGTRAHADGTTQQNHSGARSSFQGSAPVSRLHRTRPDGDRKYSNPTSGQVYKPVDSRASKSTHSNYMIDELYAPEPANHNKSRPNLQVSNQVKCFATPQDHRRSSNKDIVGEGGEEMNQGVEPQAWHSSSAHHRRELRQPSPHHRGRRTADERPLVELFKKNRCVSTPTRGYVRPKPMDRKNRMEMEAFADDEEETGPLHTQLSDTFRNTADVHRPQRMKHRSRRYENPTVASQMKQTGARYFYGNTNNTKIPFIVSKSTAPSHNIGVNLQQVLNGLKVQQPVTGIPLTIAQHMGLGHIPVSAYKSATSRPQLEVREMNSIQLGGRQFRLPSYKHVSYSRLLALYREGDGVVSRFLRAINRPHFFYTSMYNLSTNREDFDGATSKGRACAYDAKQTLAEYTSLYREFEKVEKCIKEGNCEPELERRKEELARELGSREGQMRQVMQEYRGCAEGEAASVPHPDGCHSTYQLNSFDRAHGTGDVPL